MCYNMSLFFGCEGTSDKGDNLSLSGGTMKGDINMNLSSIKNVVAANDPGDVITKRYIDGGSLTESMLLTL